VSCQLRLLEALVDGSEGCPPLVLLLPKARKAGVAAGLRRGARGVLTLGSKEYRCMFLCSCCLRTFCGPRGAGYTVRDPSALLKAVAPVVALGLKLLVAVAALAAKAASGGAVNVTLPGGGSLSGAAAELEGLADLLDAGADLALDEVVGALVTKGPPGGAVAAAAGEMQRVTGDAYARLKVLLDTLDPPNRSQLHARLGLELLVGGKGTAAVAKQWVCRACKPGFEKAGADFVPN
jgi:hypothetical protein